MPYYRFVLKTGHRGTLKSGEMVVYICHNSYTQAMNKVKQMPMVQHGGSKFIISSCLVDESEYVKGLIKNPYEQVLGSMDEVSPLNRICKILSHIRYHKFETLEGQTLQQFASTYAEAKGKKKREIENEYYSWAQDLITQNANTF